MPTYAFTFIFVGTGDTQDDALRDAADSVGLYDLVEQEPSEVENLDVPVLKRYQVMYTRRPTAYNPRQSAVIEAVSPQDAVALLADALGDTVRYTLSDGEYTCNVHVIQEPVELPAAPTTGRVISL